MFNKKGKRKIIVEGNTYYWSVKGCYHCPCCPLKVDVSIFSDEKYLFEIMTEEFITKYNTSTVTPAIVREIILEYTHNLLNMKRVN